MPPTHPIPSAAAELQLHVPPTKAEQQPPQQHQAHEDDDDETAGVFAFLAEENRRGQAYYYLRLGLILLLPLALALGFLSQQLAGNVGSLRDMRSLQSALLGVERASSAALALGDEMLAGAQLCLEPTGSSTAAAAAAARFRLASAATAATMAASSAGAFASG